MHHVMKQFAEELNKSLDDLGTPTIIRERAVILSKMFHIPKQQAWAFLEGHLFPEDDLLKRMTDELEFDVKPFLNVTQSK